MWRSRPTRDQTAVGVDDLPSNRQTKSGAVSFGGFEELEDVEVGRNSRSRILDFDHDSLIFGKGEADARVSRGQRFLPDLPGKGRAVTIHPVRRRRLSNTVGFDDAPFPRGYHGEVKVVGAVFADRRFDGVLVAAVEKDGSDAASVLAATITGSRFFQHIHLVLLQGVALAGFNVVDAFALHERIERPILVVARKRPDMNAIRRALESRVPEGEAKWRLIEQLGPMEPCAGVYVQRVGLTGEQAGAVIARLAIHSQIPEPLRVAHLIAGALENGASRGRP
jgi:endonuclease V-like protein UPF0215 family